MNECSFKTTNHLRTVKYFKQGVTCGTLLTGSQRDLKQMKVQITNAQTVTGRKSNERQESPPGLQSKFMSKVPSRCCAIIVAVPNFASLYHEPPTNQTLWCNTIQVGPTPELWTPDV